MRPQIFTQYRTLTLLSEHRIFPWVLKLPALLYPRTACSADTTSIVAQDVDGMKHDDVRCFGRLGVLAGSGLVVQLRRRQRRDVRRVRGRYRDTIGWTLISYTFIQDESIGLTLEESHRAVQALRAELIVAKGPKQLADEDVDLFGHLQSTHVTVQELDLFVAPFCLVALLQTTYYLDQ